VGEILRDLHPQPLAIDIGWQADAVDLCAIIAPGKIRYLAAAPFGTVIAPRFGRDENSTPPLPSSTV
jgi:hypothetical protein